MRPTLYPERREGRATMTAGSGESQQAPYGRALWDDAKKKGLFAEVVKTTEIAKRGGVLERTEEGKSESTLKFITASPGPASIPGQRAGAADGGVTAASWHTVRAAVLHELADEYRRWRKAGDKEPDFARALTRQRGRDVRSSRSRRWRRWSGHLANRCPLARRDGPCRRCRGRNRSWLPRP